MRDHSAWAPALIVTFATACSPSSLEPPAAELLSATLSPACPWVRPPAWPSCFAFTLSAVTHTPGRQLGGDGAWAPTIGLAMLITTLTDVPRLSFALFLGGGNSFVQLLGWLTWLACAWR